MAEKDDYLVDILVDLGFVSADQVAELQREAQAAGVGLVDLMVANKLVRPADVTQAKAAHFGAEVVNLSGLKIEDDVIAMIPRLSARSTVFSTCSRWISRSRSLPKPISKPLSLSTMRTAPARWTQNWPT